MGRFVEISIGTSGLDSARARAVMRVCPVDIFTIPNGQVLSTHPAREDECILCGRCVAEAPDAVRVRRAYGDRRPVTPNGGRGA